MIDKAKVTEKLKNLKLISKDIVLYDIPKNDFLFHIIQFNSSAQNLGKMFLIKFTTH